MLRLIIKPSTKTHLRLMNLWEDNRGTIVPPVDAEIKIGVDRDKIAAVPWRLVNG
jgi:hypothetical protein